MKRLILIALTATLTISFANANPEERAQMLKASFLQRMSQDGWQLTQETHSQLVFEKRADAFSTGLMMAMTGTSASWALNHVSITFVPVDDHHTNAFWTWTVNNQNAFGQTTSVPIKNKRTEAYFKTLSNWASGRLPPKYRWDGNSGVK
jgi:hypothetical protein